MKIHSDTGFGDGPPTHKLSMAGGSYSSRCAAAAPPPTRCARLLLGEPAGSSFGRTFCIRKKNFQVGNYEN